MGWYLTALKRYVDFNGRARRKEYWMFVLFNYMIFAALFVIGLISGGEGLATTLSYGYSLGVLLPTLAVAVRRLHDTNHSGFWLFISLVPLVGAIVLFVFFVRDGDPDRNQYGPYPKALAP